MILYGGLLSLKVQPTVNVRAQFGQGPTEALLLLANPGTPDIADLTNKRCQYLA
jgi:hypothetical protein